MKFAGLRTLFQVKAGQRWLRVVLAGAIIALITLAGTHLTHVNATTVGFVYLVAILFIATGWGLVEAIAASLLGVIFLNFFFMPPIGTFVIADPQNWAALFAFLATAIVASQLSSHARQRTQQAVARQVEMERLYAFSRALLLTDPAQPAARQIAERIVQSFDCRAVALYDRNSGETHRAGGEDLGAIEEALQQAVLQGTVSTNELTGTAVTPVRLGGQPIGSLAIRGAALPDAALQALANLVAIGLEQERAKEATSRAEASRQSEELKSALLDAIAHEFKTPLTSIKAAATALLCAPAPKPEEQRELLTVINEESDHLGRLVTEATQTARIEAGRMVLSKEPHSVGGLISAALSQMEPVIEGRAVGVTIAPGLPQISADGELMVRAIRQLLDNASKYSPPSSPISVEAGMEGDAVTIVVADKGPGISAAEQERVFEKFFRSPAHRSNLPGSGMGLNIARAIVRAHGGEIRLDSSPGAGSRFCISIPVAGEGQRP